MYAKVAGVIVALTFVTVLSLQPKSQLKFFMDAFVSLE